MFTYELKPGQKVISSFSGDYAFLSNFHPVDITLKFGEQDVTFPSVEHAFQACKTLNVEEAIKVSKEQTPAKAKKAGGRNGYVTLRADWEQIKYEVMKNLLRLKFFNTEHLQKALAATSDAILIEGNTWRDTDWGICNGRGENHLGLLLMDVREEILKAYPGCYNRPRCYGCLLRCTYCDYKHSCTMRESPDRIQECSDHPCNLTIEECDALLDSIKRD